MNIICCDTSPFVLQLRPFTYTRPLSEMRLGICTLSEKWRMYANANISWLTSPYLQDIFPVKPAGDDIYVNGAVSPSPMLIDELHALEKDEVLMQGDAWVAVKGQFGDVNELEKYLLDHGSQKQSEAGARVISRPWQLFQYNGEEITSDFKALTQNRSSQPLSDPHARCYAEENIFLEPGAEVKAAILDASGGPIYLGRNSRVQPGAIVIGPFSLGEGAQINPGAKIRGDTTVGPFCKVGGEVSNSILFEYSNKSHDGFLGNAVLAAWCNLGADTNASNLKNNYDETKLWDFKTQSFIPTGFQFCGLFMGDHSKTGINTMFNTATMVGVGANVFGPGFPRTHIPSFAWGGAHGFTTFRLSKMLEMAGRVMQRRDKILGQAEEEMLTYLFEKTAEFRIWEKGK